MSELIVHASDIMIEPMVQEEKARKEFSQRLALIKLVYLLMDVRLK